MAVVVGMLACGALVVKEKRMISIRGHAYGASRLEAVRRVLVHTIVLVFMVLLTWLGFQSVLHAGAETSPALGLRVMWIRAAIPFGIMLMTLRYLLLMRPGARPADEDAAMK